MTSQIPFTPLSGEALSRLSPDERMAFEAAAVAVAGDQKPGLEVIATLVLTIQRLIAEPPELAAFWLAADEDGDIILSAPCADTLGCLWSSHAGERVTLGELRAAAAAHTGMAAGRAHAALAIATGMTEEGPPNNGRPVIHSGAAAPGGWVCAVPVPGNPDHICGMPVESEPCTGHEEAGRA